MRTGTIKLAAALALVTLAAGCGGEAAAPVQTVDLSGLIEVDKLNEKLPVEKEQLEAAIAETLQERAPAGVQVVYNPGAPPVQRPSQSSGGNQGSGKQKSPPPPATGTPPAPPGTPAKPSPGENAPSPATCAFDPSKAGCENFCAQNPESANCKKSAPGTPAPGTPAPSPATCGSDPSKPGCETFCEKYAQYPSCRPKVGDILPRPPKFAEFSHCRQTETGPVCYPQRLQDPFVRRNSPPGGSAAPADGDKPLTAGDPAPTQPPLTDGTGEVPENCTYRKQGDITCDIVGKATGSLGFPCPPAQEAACASIQPNRLCVADPTVCDDFGNPEPVNLTPPLPTALSKPEFLKSVIDDSFEKVGVEFEPGSATAAVSLAEISIAGVKANVEASETGEIVTRSRRLSVPTSRSGGKRRRGRGCR